jgi:hypothetical protein
MKIYLVTNMKRKIGMHVDTGEASKAVLQQGGT